MWNFGQIGHMYAKNIFIPGGFHLFMDFILFILKQKLHLEFVLNASK